MKTQVGFPELLPPLLIFTRQFATLVQHGVTIRQCCVLLGEDAPQPYAEFAYQLGERVEAGKTIFESMSISDNMFPPLYLAMIKAGEVGGVLDEFFGYLAELLEDEWEFRRQGALGDDDLLLFNPALGPSDWRELSDGRRLMTLSLWCRTMSMLLSARVPLDIALLTGAKLLPPKQQQKLQQEAKHEEFITVLRSINFLPATALTLIGLGQQAGTLDLALDQLARLYRDTFRYTRVKPAKQPARHAATERERRLIATPQAKSDLDVILRAAGLPGIVGETITIDPQLGGIIPRNLQDRYHAAPVRRTGNRLVVAMINPGDVAALDDMRLVTGYEIKPLRATDTEIEKIHTLQQGQWTPDWSKLEQEVTDTAGGSPIIRMVNVLIENAIKQGATEILQELAQGQVNVHFRIEGELREVMTLPKFAHLPLVERLKIMANLPLQEEPPQRGHIHIRHERQDYDAIVETAAGEHGEVVTLRIAKQKHNDILQRSGARADTGRSIDDRKRSEVNIPIGKLLLDSGKISRDQLKQALTLQKSTTEKLGQLLIDLGFVSEQYVLDAYAQQQHLDLPVVPDPSVANAIPEHLQKRYDVVSLRRDGTKLFVAMADPTNVDALDDLRLITGFEIKPVPMTREEILAIRRSISDSDVEDAPIIRMVNVLFQNAIKQGATQILLEPDQRQVTVRYFIEGELREVMTLPTFAHLPLVQRLKMMSQIPLDVAPPQRGHIYTRHEHEDYDAIVEIGAGEFGEVITIGITKRGTAESPESRRDASE